jgi:hypothetical protein
LSLEKWIPLIELDGGPISFRPDLWPHKYLHPNECVRTRGVRLKLWQGCPNAAC